MTSTARHCDDVIHDRSLPSCIRYFLLVHRLPALDKSLLIEVHGEPTCFATFNCRRVRLTMASRFGDVGVTYNLDSVVRCYDERVYLDDLSDFSRRSV